MELDDLKETWKQSTKNQKPKNTDIMELIQHKSYGPVSQLKKAFLKQIRLMIIIPLFIFFTNLNDVQHVLTSVMFWSYITLCAGLVVYSWRNYLLVRKMEIMDNMVKPNLEQQVSVLETRLRWQINGVRLALIFFIILTEVLPYFQHYRMLDKWHSLSPWIRFSVYAAFLLLQYFTARAVLQRKFGQHIDYLKGLVREME